MFSPVNRILSFLSKAGGHVTGFLALKRREVVPKLAAQGNDIFYFRNICFLLCFVRKGEIFYVKLNEFNINIKLILQIAK